jgi:hypothetical protein
MSEVADGMDVLSYRSRTGAGLAQSRHIGPNQVCTATSASHRAPLRVQLPLQPQSWTTSNVTFLDFSYVKQHCDMSLFNRMLGGA